MARTNQQWISEVPRATSLAEGVPHAGARHLPARPLVSVVIPCYNASRTIVSALDSVFAQRLNGFEVIVVNDGSPDTPALEALLLPFGDDIRYFRQENIGPAAARNIGIREARGRYVAFLDSDDVWHPDFLETQLATLEARPGLAMTYCDVVIAGDTPRAGKRIGELVPAPDEVSFENLVRRRCIIHPSSVVARRAALLGAGSFDEAIRYSEDLDLWLRLLHRGERVGYVKQVLVQRNSHHERLTADVMRLIRSQLTISRKLLETVPDMSAPERAALQRNVRRCMARIVAVRGVRQLLAGRTREARRSFAIANGVLRDWRLLGASIGLDLAPGLARSICISYLTRHRVFLLPSSGATVKR